MDSLAMLRGASDPGRCLVRVARSAVVGACFLLQPAVVFRIILHDAFSDDFRRKSGNYSNCLLHERARGEGVDRWLPSSGKFPSGGTDDRDLFCFAPDMQLNRGLDGSAMGWQGVVRSGTVFCRIRLRGLTGSVGSNVGMAVAQSFQSLAEWGRMRLAWGFWLQISCAASSPSRSAS